jgi:hypothetical protein
MALNTASSMNDSKLKIIWRKVVVTYTEILSWHLTWRAQIISIRISSVLAQITKKDLQHLPLY